MIEREIAPYLERLFRQYPMVTVTGPRQSGKTTLCRSTFPHLRYANLEAPDQRDTAEHDPRGFLAELGEGAILDEVQNVPHLLSYLQVIADESGDNSLFVLTGSEQFGLSTTITQSLAGRTALLRLLPLSLGERRQASANESVDQVLFSGFYPRIIDQDLSPTEALGDYFENYVEREVRRLGGVRNLSGFRRFVRICAGRIGHLTNLTALGDDVGVSRKTAAEWLEVLERSYIVFRLEPYSANLRKRLVKSPKLYFYDVGLASYLIGINRADQVATHPLKGALFENAVVVEALKYRFNRGHRSNLWFFRDSRNLECDLFYEIGRHIAAIEIKSGATVSSDALRPIRRVAELVPDVSSQAIVYGGAVRQTRGECEIVPFAGFAGLLERYEAEEAMQELLTGPHRWQQAETDIEILDAAYNNRIRPLLEGLERTLQPLAEVLFAGSRTRFTVTWRNQESTFDQWLQTGSWEIVKQECLVEEGFSLQGWQFELRYEYEFKSYIGPGRKGFPIVVSNVWEFGGEEFRQWVMVGGEPIPALNNPTPYADLNSPGDIDGGVAKIITALRKAIRTHSLS